MNLRRLRSELLQLGLGESRIVAGGRPYRRPPVRGLEAIDEQGEADVRHAA